MTDEDPEEPPTNPKGRGKVTVVRHAHVEPELFVTDAEMFKRLGVSEKVGYTAIHMLDRELSRGFPQKQKVWGGRRYWPAVHAWFNMHYGFKGSP